MTTILEFLGSLSAIQLGVGMAVAAAAMAIVLNWRLALYGMLLQYLFVSLLLDMVLPGGLALVKLVAGVVACVTLYWTGWRIEAARHWRYAQEDVPSSGSTLDPLGLPFRLLALVFAVLVLYTVPERLGFTFFLQTFLVPAVWLVVMGLLTIILTRDPLKTGLGLLTFQNGFELLYHLVEPGLLVLALLNVGTILVGFVASYLAIAAHLPLIEEWRAVPSSPEALAEAVDVLNPVETEPDPRSSGVAREEVPA
jgi:hypothetical protein